MATARTKKTASKATEKSPDEKLLEQARERWKIADEFWSPIIKKALEDIRFVDLREQWSAQAITERDLDDRPSLVVDKLSQYVRQVVNDARQNRPQPKVRPVDDKGDPEVAKIMEGIVRDILTASSADDATDTAIDRAVKGGIGWLRVITEWEDAGWTQRIRVKRVRNISSVRIDPFFQEADGSDIHWGFFVEDVPKSEFNQKWPDAKKNDWSLDFKNLPQGWLSEKTVRVCEYFYEEPTVMMMFLLEDGTVTKEEDYQLAVTKGDQPPPPIVKRRAVKTTTVRWCRHTGAEILEKNDWPGDMIPIIPVFGEETDIEGKLELQGLVRRGRDPQRLYNYSRSAYAERVSLAPKAPWLVAEGTTEDYDDEWATANTRNHNRLRWRSRDDDGQELPEPRRESMSDVPSGFIQDMQLSEHDIQAALGMYNSSIGERSNEKSGRAIMARQKEGDTATFHFPDNLRRAERLLGRQIISLIPKVLTGRQVARMLGEDGKATNVQLDPRQAQAVTRNGRNKIYNLGVGKYDLTITAGPSYNTKRMEAADFMSNVVQGNPQLMQLIGDIMFRNMDIAGADEVAERLRATLPPEIQALTQDDGENPEVKIVKAQAAKALQAAQQQIGQLTQVVQALQQQVTEKYGEHILKDRKANIDAFNADTNRLKVVGPALQPDDIKQLVVEIMARIMSEQAAGGGQPGAFPSAPAPSPAAPVTPPATPTQ